MSISPGWCGYISSIAEVHVDDESQHFQTLYRFDESNNCIEPYAPLLEYFWQTGKQLRPSTQRSYVRIVGALLSYMDARDVSSLDSVSRELLGQFVDAQCNGTLHLADAERGGLFWRPRSRNVVANDLTLLNRFTDWLSNRQGTRLLNPWRKASSTERLVALRRAEHLSASSLAWSGNRGTSKSVAWARSVSVKGIDSPIEDIKSFDACRFPALLLQGFGLGDSRKSRHERERQRNALIALLLHGGGLRLSEAFHLFPEDVTLNPNDPDSALVRLYHPSLGAAPEDGKRWKIREDYLNGKYGLKPRHRVAGRFHAGWKNLALSNNREKCAVVHWFPSHWGRLFLTLFRQYLAMRPKGLNHPYLFFSEGKQHRGEPYTLASFRQAHARAVRRIGLVPERHRGNTPHGHRHAYGMALAQALVDPETIRRAMHHRSLTSQNAYTRGNEAAFIAELRAANERWEKANPMPSQIRSLLP